MKKKYKNKNHPKKQVKKYTKRLLFGVGVFGIVFVINTFPSSETNYEPASIKTDTEKTNQQEQNNNTNLGNINHINTPESVKSIYMSSCVAGTPSFRSDLVDIADTTEINSIIIDIKDYTGKISFPLPEHPVLKDYLSDRCYAPDMKEFIELLHSKGIYVIGRITVFQDPYYTSLHPETAVKNASDGKIWRDKKGISYIDPSSKRAWNHVLELARESHKIGFDEINFDYIRFPTDGNMKDIHFPHSKDREKPEVIEEFFAYVKKEMDKANITTSADLFGMVTTNYDDLNIGQVLEKGLPYFDYIAPMVYPSHYPATFNGWDDPNDYPYELMKYVLDSAVERTVATTTPIKTKGSVRVGTSTPAMYTKESYDPNKIRPWLQDFDYGGDYDVAEVRAQIEATYDAGLNSWFLWAPSNRYTIGALEKEE